MKNYHPVGMIAREARNHGWYDLLMRQYAGKKYLSLIK